MCNIFASRLDSSVWILRSQYYGRGTRNHEAGTCCDANCRPLFAHKRMRISVNQRPMVEVDVPFAMEWINMNCFPDPQMILPVPLQAGSLELVSLSFRDIRATEEYEISGMEFRIVAERV